VRLEWDAIECLSYRSRLLVPFLVGREALDIFASCNIVTSTSFEVLMTSYTQVHRGCQWRCCLTCGRTALTACGAVKLTDGHGAQRNPGRVPKGPRTCALCRARAAALGCDVVPRGRVQVNGQTVAVVGRLLVTWKFMLMDSRMFADSFRLCITRERVREKAGMTWMHTLCFWCLDPQVAFRHLSTQCRSIVLASGAWLESRAALPSLSFVMHSVLYGS
jgi:hypothetical protein